jgi:Flp pilus assembly protein TadD
MRLIILGLAAALAGCSALPVVQPAEEAWLLAAAAAPDVDPATAHVEVPDEESLLALTPQMQRFAEDAVAGLSNDNSRLRALLRAIVDPRQLGLQFDQTVTYTATQAFEHARANCLSFAALFIAMARHVDLDAHFNEVDVPPVWDMHGRDTLVLYKHVNALVSAGRGRWMAIDVFPEEYDISFPQRKISDRQATAQYYNNLAMGFLREDHLGAARRHLARAIAIAPDTSYLWGNLGASYRRAGQDAAAELAFVKAINIDPRDHVASSNAARLFADTGRPEIASRLERRAARFRKQNPYYRYRQALDAMAADQYASAKHHALAAIHLYGNEHRFHFLLGAVYRQLGDRERARQSFVRAIELADGEQASQYGRKMEMLMSAAL